MSVGKRLIFALAISLAAPTGLSAASSAALERHKVCRFAQPGEPPDAFARRVARLLVSDLPDGSRRVLKWPGDRAVKLRYMLGSRHLRDGRINDPSFSIVVDALSTLADSSEIDFDPRRDVPLGEANTRVMAAHRSMSALTFFEIEDTGQDPGRAANYERLKQFGYHGLPLVRRTGAHGWTDCVALAAYNDRWEIQGATLAIITHSMNAYWASSVRDLRQHLRRERETLNKSRSGLLEPDSIPPRIAYGTIFQTKHENIDLSSTQEIQQCALDAVSWILGATATRSADAPDQTDVLALLYDPRVRHGDLEPVVRATIVHWAEDEGCF